MHSLNNNNYKKKLYTWLLIFVWVVLYSTNPVYTIVNQSESSASIATTENQTYDINSNNKNNDGSSTNKNINESTLNTEDTTETTTYVENEESTNSNNENLVSSESISTSPDTLLQTNNNTNTSNQMSNVPSPENTVNNLGSNTSNEQNTSGNQNSTNINPTPVQTPTPAPTPSPFVCQKHEYQLTNTKTDVQYELYSYITETYQCKHCDATKSATKKISNNLSVSALNNIENQIISYVNQLRSANNLPALSIMSNWNGWADTRAQELSVKYGHVRPDGSSWAYAMGNEYTVGENVAAGQSTGYAFYQAFLNSASHKDMMLAKDAKGISVGLYIDQDGNSYCAMIFTGTYD